MSLSARGKFLALVAIVGMVAACSSTPGAASSSAQASQVAVSQPPASSEGPSAAPDGTLPQPELTTVRIGVSAPDEPVDFRGQLAVMLGIFEKYGLKAEVTGFEGDAKTLQALTAGQIDFGIGAVSNAISSQLSDTPNVVVAVGRLLNTDALWCRKAIKTAADVKGKTVAISTFGGTSHASALAAIKGLQFTPSDVTITQVGGEPARVAALKGGSVDCIIASAVYPGTTMTDMGANAVIDMSLAKIYIGSGATEARVDWLAQNPNTALVALAAMLEAHNSMWADSATAAAKFAEYSQSTPADALDYMKQLADTANRSMMWTDDALQVSKDTMATVRPEIANVDLTKVSDHSFLQKLADLGFYQKIGDPLP